MNTIFTALVLLSFSGAAYAAEQQTTYLGGLVGENFSNKNASSSNNTNYGITAGSKITPFVGFGFYGTYFRDTQSAAAFGLSDGTQTRTYNLAGELNLFAGIFHAGGDVGAGITTWGASNATSNGGSSQTDLIYGPEGGFDFPIAGPLSVGAEVHYLMTNASAGRNNLQALGALKVWL